MDLKIKSIMNVAETYRKMYEAEEKAVYTAHHFTQQGHTALDDKFKSVKHAKKALKSEHEQQADSDYDFTNGPIGGVVVKHHNGQHTVVNHHYTHDDYRHSEHTTERMKSDALHHAKKMDVSKMDVHSFKDDEDDDY